MSDEPNIPEAKRIKGARLVNGQWQDPSGNPLTNAQLIKLRAAQEREKAAAARERKKAQEE
jgi:hypothetical protein